MFLVPNPHPRKHARESRSKKFFQPKYVYKSKGSDSIEIALHATGEQGIRYIEINLRGYC